MAQEQIFNVGDRVRLYNMVNSGLSLTVKKVLTERFYPICVARDDDPDGFYFRVDLTEIRRIVEW